jgi:hypothetical protein
MTRKTLEDYLPLDGLGLTYSQEEARQAIANAEAAANINPGNGSGEPATIDFGTKTDAATMPIGGVGINGWLSSIKEFVGSIKDLISDRIPALSNGKIPVEVASLSVTINNASLEISNDVGNPVPVTINNTSPLVIYELSESEETTTTSYYGFLDKDGNWYIQKASISGATTTARYCAGTTASGGYIAAWSGRVSLTYDYFNVIF